MRSSEALPVRRTGRLGGRHLWLAERRPFSTATSWRASRDPLVRANREFDVSARILVVAGLAAIAGAIAAIVAIGLVRLMGLLTNVLFYGRISWHLVTPDGSRPGWVVVLVPVAGGLVVGLLARFVTEHVRGHGLPEALGALVSNDGVVGWRAALVKPVASVVSIGTGGPFGAEGPVIATGGAVGSLVGQLPGISVAERRVLLVSGAAAGMCAVLGAPLGSVVFVLEVLLLEWSLSALVPLSVAVCVAMLVRFPFSGARPEFWTPDQGGVLSPAELAGCVVLGVACALLAVALTAGVRGSERLFARTRLHWMWWPAIGGVAVGVGGLVAPRATGVGYDVIASGIGGTLTVQVAVGVLLVKSVIWPVALGSGTSGGLLAPALVIGGCLGVVLAPALPGGSPTLYALVGATGLMAGLLRAPLSSIVFMAELTGRWDDLLGLMVVAVSACLLSSSLLAGSLLTDRLSLGGLVLRRDLRRDEWAAVPVSRVMDELPIAFLRHHQVEDAWGALACEVSCTSHDPTHPHLGSQTVFPVVASDGHLLGVVTLTSLARAMNLDRRHLTVGELVDPAPGLVTGSQSARDVLDVMTLTATSAVLVIEGGAGESPATRRLAGLVDLRDIRLERSRF